MLLVSVELTLPESHRSGFSSCAALEATRISYALCLPLESRQLRFGVASPSPIGLANVSTRNVVALTFPPAGSAGATVLTTGGTAPITASAASEVLTLDLIYSPLVDMAQDTCHKRSPSIKLHRPGGSRRGKSPGSPKSGVF